ncbi:hypothetical protein Tco_1455897 [Tanacetum coccineum]
MKTARGARWRMINEDGFLCFPEKEREKQEPPYLWPTKRSSYAMFHSDDDAKEMWDAIKSRFGGNDESKKMQKYILKQQFEGFSVSNTEGLHKGYDRFQSLRRVDSLSFDDLYNNLRVFESDIKGSTASSSSSQNVAFISENTSSTNEEEGCMEFWKKGWEPKLDRRGDSKALVDQIVWRSAEDMQLVPHPMTGKLHSLQDSDVEIDDLSPVNHLIRYCDFYDEEDGRKVTVNAMDYPHRALRIMELLVSGCSGTLTGNKAPPCSISKL